MCARVWATDSVLFPCPDAFMQSLCFHRGCVPRIPIPNQAATSGMNGKNVPQPGDVVLLIGNVPAGGGEVRPAFDLSKHNDGSQAEPMRQSQV